MVLTGATAIYIGNSGVTKVYQGDIQVWPKGTPPTPVIPYNEIWYTSTDRHIVTPTSGNTWAIPNVNIVSNTYADEWGVIKFDGDITTFPTSAFRDCTTLSSVIIPGGVTELKVSVFNGCTSLSSITIPDSVFNIDGHCFADCSSLRSITLPSSLTNIEEYSFIRCTSLSSVTIGNNVTDIWSNAFDSCSSLPSITIPDSVAKLDVSVFKNCTALSSIVIGTGVTTIADYIFMGCTLLTSISYRGTMDQWASVTKDSNWNYNAPATVVHCSDGDVPI